MNHCDFYHEDTIAIDTDARFLLPARAYRYFSGLRALKWESFNSSQVCLYTISDRFRRHGRDVANVRRGGKIVLPRSLSHLADREFFFVAFPGTIKLTDLETYRRQRDRAAAYEVESLLGISLDGSPHE